MKGNATLEERINDFDPTDPEAAAALEQELFSPGDETKDDGTQEGDELGGGEPEQQDDKPADAGEGEPSVTEGKPQGVLTRDGKHVIPYNVLENERAARARAEAAIDALNRQLDELKAGGDAQAEGANAVQITDDELTELEDISPEIAKVIKAQMTKIEQITGELVHLKGEQDRQRREREQQAQDEVEAAIAANTSLSEWRKAAFREENPDPAMWKRALAVDEMLRSDPAWADKSFAERFAKVTEVVSAMTGAPAPKKETHTDLKRAAEERLQGASTVPTSLSDIPGGAPPAQSDIETLENASAVALGQKFASMSPDQMESYLARLGM